MKTRLLLLLTLSGLMSFSAQAADVRLGLSAAPTILPVADLMAPIPAPGLFVSRTGHFSDRTDFRSKFGVEYLLFPILHADVTWLSRRDLYFGGGFGTGLAFNTSDAMLYSPLLLANVHGVVGKNFGPWQVEGQARLGLLPSVGLNVSYLLGR